MRTAEFSEFSYGYALMDNIMHGAFPLTPNAPTFPSLRAEGGAAGGYDVQIPFAPVAAFLQFKIPQILRRRSHNMPAGFAVPYMRMPLRTGQPNQHQLLIDLEAAGHIVSYASPDFYTTADLDHYFITQQVPFRSRYFAPLEIGALNDESHHVAYRRGFPGISVRSEPKALEGKFGLDNFAKKLDQAVQVAEAQDSVAFLTNLASTIAKISKADRIIGQLEEPDGFGRQPVKFLARQIGYLAQVRLGCVFMVTGRGNDAAQP